MASDHFSGFFYVARKPVGSKSPRGRNKDRPGEAVKPLSGPPRGKVLVSRYSR